MPIEQTEQKRHEGRRWRDPAEETGPELLEDMTASDLIWTLQRLIFPRPSKRGNATCVIALDRHARDFLVASVKARCGGK